MIDHLAILAPGLLGASVARAARHFGAARRITLWARRPEVRVQLKSQPWCDAVADTPADAARQASLTVVCAPVDQIVALTSEIAPALPAGAIVTDVGSVKGEICRQGHKALPAGRHFVGSHPMAGSEKTGWEHGRADLFQSRVTFVTPLPETDPKAAEAVAAFWTALGSDVAGFAPDAHDEIVAHISHLPQVLASTLCASLAKRDPKWRNYSGGGLRDTSRIAGSDPKLWKTILEQNRDEVLRALRAYQDELHGMERALANRDWFEVQAILERGRAYREQFRPIP
ncbi:prephenate dehydrogenase/arogenate dehydrogenase family protein [Oleiharenicola lentus]|uniref:Prephenate dehydrogenase/arogenate dehydrogenase family protein n=1 Tax=Oleiharenicola lentus TaxID=2508720 RepID=A0A4V1M6T1_9BACT|nr:prephenate dehydrogenase/arogenate dehydrogenase family protein [Oleiharenicola lentus]RXK56479.1 prephenate dehydrogenase/arogenate dehydrogenase family protein [Oleiharenicola lentus]